MKLKSTQVLIAILLATISIALISLSTAKVFAALLMVGFFAILVFGLNSMKKNNVPPIAPEHENPNSNLRSVSQLLNITIHDTSNNLMLINILLDAVEKGLSGGTIDNAMIKKLNAAKKGFDRQVELNEKLKYTLLPQSEGARNLNQYSPEKRPEGPEKNVA